MASAADSGVETGNDSNDSSIQDKLFRMDLDTPKQFTLQDKVNCSGAETSQEDLIRPHSSSDIMPGKLLKPSLQPSAMSYGCKFHPKKPSSDKCFALSLRPESNIGGVFVSRVPLGSNYKGSDLVRKLRHAVSHSSATPDYLKLMDAVRMCRAACHNNTDAVRDMLRKGKSPNVFDGYKRTPLHLAACMGYAEMVELLLDHGADPNAKDSVGNTPLHLAACTNHVPVITLLLRAGTRVSTTHSPLQLAITKFNIIQRSEMPHPVLKEQVAQVISMLTEYIRRKEAPSLDAELLNRFESLIRVSDSSEQVESGICDLLSNLSSLDISSS